MSESKSVAFFVKCRPFSEFDAFEVAKEFRFAFVGYALEDPSGHYLDPLHKDDYCARIKRDKNRVRLENFANQVGQDSYVVVPRVSEGRCWIGEVAGVLMTRSPEPAHMRALKQCAGETTKKDPELEREIVQRWQLSEEWRSVPFFRVPRWISYQFFLRSSFGILSDGTSKKDRDAAYKVIADLYKNHNEETPLDQVRAESEVRERLRDWISPKMFEQLAVELLQVESVAERQWLHVGGSGDGGLDGVGLCRKTGTMREVLQCKWMLPKPDVVASHLRKDIEERRKHAVKPEIFWLFTLDDLEKRKDWRTSVTADESRTWWRLTRAESDVEIRIVDLPKVAERLWRHRAVIPLAWTMGLHTPS